MAGKSEDEGSNIVIPTRYSLCVLPERQCEVMSDCLDRAAAINIQLSQGAPLQCWCPFTHACTSAGGG